VSRVILRRFAGDVRGRQKVMSYRVNYGLARPAGLDTAGTIRNFLTVASGSAEKLWGDVENSLNPVLDCLSTPQVLLGDDYVSTIREVIALHYARSDAVRQLGVRMYGELKARFKKCSSQVTGWNFQNPFISRLGFYSGNLQRSTKNFSIPY
jgi:hypothetical protein